MKITDSININLCLLLILTGCHETPIETHHKTFNSYHILNNTNSNLLSKIVTIEFDEIPVFELPAGQRIVFFSYWGDGAFPVTPREAVKRVTVFKDSAGVLNQVYVQDPINNSLWKRKSSNSYYDYTLEINEDDIH